MQTDGIAREARGGSTDPFGGPLVGRDGTRGFRRGLVERREPGRHRSPLGQGRRHPMTQTPGHGVTDLLGGVRRVQVHVREDEILNGHWIPPAWEGDRGRDPRKYLASVHVGTVSLSTKPRLGVYSGFTPTPVAGDGRLICNAPGVVL